MRLRLSVLDQSVATAGRGEDEALRDTLDLTAREKPDVAVLIDSWGFNIRLAQALREADLLGVTTIHAFAKRTLEDAAFESRQPFANTLITDTVDLITFQRLGNRKDGQSVGDY